MKDIRITKNRVLGPLGEYLTLSDLPVSDMRWVPRRKAVVVIAIDHGLLSVEEACQRYSLSLEELTSWRELYVRRGISGLQARRTAANEHRLQ